MAQNIIYSPWERTKGPWLCLMTTLLLFSLLWLFSFVSTFLTSLIKLILWLKLSTDKRQAGDMVDWGQGPWGSAPFHTESPTTARWMSGWVNEGTHWQTNQQCCWVTRGDWAFFLNTLPLKVKRKARAAVCPGLSHGVKQRVFPWMRVCSPALETVLPRA